MGLKSPLYAPRTLEMLSGGGYPSLKEEENQRFVSPEIGSDDLLNSILSGDSRKGYFYFNPNLGFSIKYIYITSPVYPNKLTRVISFARHSNV